MNQELYIKTLLHELVHLRQWVTGSLRAKRGKRYYDGTNVEDIEYWEQPHEIIARREEILLYQEYMNETSPVPVHKVAQCFPNRLLNAL